MGYSWNNNIKKDSLIFQTHLTELDSAINQASELICLSDNNSVYSSKYLTFNSDNTDTCTDKSHNSTVFSDDTTFFSTKFGTFTTCVDNTTQFSDDADFRHNTTKFNTVTNCSDNTSHFGDDADCNTFNSTFFNGDKAGQFGTFKTTYNQYDGYSTSQTVEITDRTFVQTYSNSSTASTTDARSIGYAASSGSYRFTAVYKFVLPTFSGTFTNMKLNVFLSPLDSAISRNCTYKVNVLSIAPSTGATRCQGYYTQTGTGIQSFSVHYPNGMGGTDWSSATLTYTTSHLSSLKSGATIYIYVFSGAAEYNQCKIASLTGTVTYSG